MFESLSIPLMKLIGAKEGEMSDEGRSSSVVFVPPDILDVTFNFFLDLINFQLFPKCEIHYVVVWIFCSINHYLFVTGQSTEECHVFCFESEH